MLADTEEAWGRIFQAAGRHYRAPVLVLFENGVQSACGSASSASGPFYCPSDQKVYLDLSFFRELDQRFGAPGDFAQAYVVAHEIGHHVQHLLGLDRQAAQARRRAAAAMRTRCQWRSNSRPIALPACGDITRRASSCSTRATSTKALSGGRDRRRSSDQGPRLARQLHARHLRAARTMAAAGASSGSINSCDTFRADTL